MSLAFIVDDYVPITQNKYTAKFTQAYRHSTTVVVQIGVAIIFRFRLYLLQSTPPFCYKFSAKN